MSTNSTDMTQGKPASLILKFAFPLVIANLFQQAYSVVDNIIVGRWVGANAFSAVGATIALTNTFMAMCWGSTIGLSVVISQYFGAKDEEKTAAAIINGFYVCIVIAIFMTVAALSLTRPLLRLLNTPEELLEDAVMYMQVIVGGGLVIVTAYNSGFSALRAFGDSKTPLLFMIAANVLNVGLDLLFVGPLGMGVFGAALATVLSQLIAAVCCLGYAFMTFDYFRRALRYPKPDRRLIGQVLKIGIPSGFQYSLIFLSGSVLQWIINGFGANVIGAFTATSRIEMLIEQPFAGLANAFVTYTGQNIGAGRIERVKQGLWVAAWASALFSLVLLLVFWTAGDAIMGIFVDDSGIVSLAARGIRITSVFFFAMGMSRVFRNLLNGAGDSLYSMVNGVVEIVGRVGLALSLTRIAFIGIWGIWAATCLTWGITMFFALWRYKSEAWMSKSLVVKMASF
ncbi:MAG: MATE family efflux transporter [Synergistaceae bacterium]|nr:MATE family efflux transporter [Synergistaceae bacterium]